jgi:hypothetical protein
MQHIGMFLHNEMGVSWRGMSSMCGHLAIHLQKIFFLRSIGRSDRLLLAPMGMHPRSQSRELGGKKRALDLQEARKFLL